VIQARSRIRLYLPADRAGIRSLCDRFAINPVPGWISRERLIDCHVRYHTDCEMRSLWVAEDDRKIVGYLAGGMDRRHYEWWMWQNTGFVLTFETMWAMLMGSRGARHTVRQYCAQTFQSGDTVDLSAFPAFFQVVVDPDPSYQDITPMLIDQFCAQAFHEGKNGVFTRVPVIRPDAAARLRLSGFSCIGTDSRYSVLTQGDSWIYVRSL